MVSLYGPKCQKNDQFCFDQFCFDKFHEDFVNRDIFISVFSWAVPDTNTLQSIVNFCNSDKVLEVGTGLGLWAHLLSKMGLDIIATDVGTTGKYYSTNSILAGWTNVNIQSYDEAINSNNDCNVLLIIWPPMTNFANKALKMFNGEKLIYIGEGKGGSLKIYVNVCIYIYFNEAPIAAQ